MQASTPTPSETAPTIADRLAQRLDRVETSAIRELFKLLGKPGIISFAGGFPDADLFDVDGMAQAAQAALAENPGPALQYGPTEGHPPLRSTLAAYMQGKGVQGIQDENLIVTTGSQQGLDLLGKTLLNEGDTVLVEGPTFLATIQCFRLYGAHLRSIPMASDGVDVDKLEQLIREHKPKLIYLIPTFGNPSGACMSLEKRLRVLSLAARYQTVLVEDDPYGDLFFTQAPPPSLLALSAQVPGSADWLIHCGSLSKILAPGLRIGWMVAPQPVLSKATMCKQFSDAHTSSFTQAMADAYLKSGKLKTNVARVRSAYAERAAAMAAALRRAMGDNIEFTAPTGGMFIWARTPAADAASLAQRALEQGVAFVPGTPFYAENPDPHSFRLSFATVNQEKIETGVARLGQALRDCS